MSNKINHDGIVDKIEVDTVKVRILQTSACAACGFAKHCSSSESKEKIIDVHTDVQGYEVGQHVVVSVSASMGYKAVLLGFGLPFLLLVVVIILVNNLTANEPLSALLGLGALVPYYLLLYLNRDRIGKSLSVEITQTKY